MNAPIRKKLDEIRKSLALTEGPMEEGEEAKWAAVEALEKLHKVAKKHGWRRMATASKESAKIIEDMFLE